MKILKIIGLIIVGLLLVITIVTFSVSTDFSYEKSIAINAPIDVVWENTNSLADLDKWSPWVAMDPNIKITRTGIDGTVGAVSSWESDVEEVGKGSQTITEIDAPNTFNTEMKFIEPWESEGKGYIQLTKNGEDTDVLWGFTSNLPRPINLMKLMPGMDETMDAEFSKGLNSLKDLCEN